MRNKRLLVLGATGMLGHTLFEQLSGLNDFDVHATARSTEGLPGVFPPRLVERIKRGVDADNFDSVIRAVADLRPNVVINCIGIIKQSAAAKDPLTTIAINSLFPHKLANLCGAAGARLIHISTDCVFSGDKGNYTESDVSDAIDLYGRTKFLGEIDGPHCLTLRTSIIGHELKSCYSLIDWFLSQEGKVRGFTRAIYTGFPTVEMARIIADYAIPNSDLNGLYHVSSEPISKYDLLKLVAEQYGKWIELVPYEGFQCDRSLDSSRFRRITGYTPPSWPEMIKEMRLDYQEHHKLAIL
jgi:dTDP-4-dehydrorhamnose reductase